MAHRSWREASKGLGDLIGPPTSLQVRLALAAAVQLPRGVPRLVADARLQLAIAKDLGLQRLPRFRGVRGLETTESQAERIRYLRAERRAPARIPRDGSEAEAWIQHLTLKRRREVLVDLKLEAGDIVETAAGLIAEVASIGEDGRVFFCGGRGRGSWPDLVTPRCRVGSVGAKAKHWRQNARTAAEAGQRMRPVSARGLRELSKFRVEALATDDDLVQLESCVERATDEKPIQEYLEAHPQVLASLLAGSDRYCIPKARLGGQYVPDFLLCYVDSAGAHWFLVELETPRSKIALASGRDLDQHAREGVAQVQEWRRWLENNVAIARASTRDDGLGLVGISPNAQGIVLVGRRELVNNNHDRLRQTVEAQQRVVIHTYDWLVDQLRRAALNHGPRGMNPALLRDMLEAEDASIATPFGENAD